MIAAAVETYPDSDVLEGDVGAAEETDEVCVKTAVGLVPHSIEWRVVLRS
jgi:hypothetical protein